MRAIDVAVTGKGGRHMEVADLARIGNMTKVVDRARVPMRDLFRIFDDFVDEVAEMKDEAQLAVGSGAFVLPDHPAIGVLRAFVDAVARHEGEADGAWIGCARGRDRSPDAAACAAAVGEAVPVGRRRKQPADERAARPVGRRQYRHTGGRDDMLERIIQRHLDDQRVAFARREWPAGPQDHAVVVGITRCDPLRIECPVLTPRGRGRRRRGSGRPDGHDAKCRAARQELPPVHHASSVGWTHSVAAEVDRSSERNGLHDALRTTNTGSGLRPGHRLSAVDSTATPPGQPRQRPTAVEPGWRAPI